MRPIDADAFDEWLQNHEEATAALEAADYVREHWNEHPTRRYCIGEELFSEDLY